MQIVYVYHDTKADTYKGLIQATSSEIQAMNKKSTRVTADSTTMTMVSGSVIQCIDDMSQTLILYENEWR